MSVIEKVEMFLFTIAVGASNRQVQERFQYSGKTISKCIKEVLKTLCLFVVDIIKPTNPKFINTLLEIEFEIYATFQIILFFYKI